MFDSVDKIHHALQIVEMTDAGFENPGHDPAIDRPQIAALPTEFEDAVVWAAWLYYADQLTQNDIAKRLKVARATVVNYLREARERGIVSIQISPAAHARTTLARGLMQRFGLLGAFVIPSDAEAPLTRRLGDAGARLLGEHIRTGDVIGVAWGRTVLAVAEQITLARPVDGLTVVQVSGSSTGSPDFSPELCTSVLSSRIHARCVNLLAPATLSSQGLRDTLLAEPVLQRQFALIRATNHILFGVGDVGQGSTVRVSGIAETADIDAYVAQGAVGVIIGRFIDADGRASVGEFDNRMVGISLEELRQVPSRICVAGGPQKIDAITATLKGGYATHLVTDSDTARMLLDRSPR
jgi:DNA-binding transcriptional regulator LsrR (DeoR family)